ncbi:MAG TPA: hypothetical protein VMV18_08170, partial [bacterium]|nr:hypothetical protein [bacterium]
MRRLSLVAALALLAPSLPARADGPADVVGNVGLRSVDVPTAELTGLESALDRAISMNAGAARAKTATLSLLDADPEISSKRADARRAMDASVNDMKTFQLDAAQTEFDKTVAFWTVAHGPVLDPSDLSRLYLQRAKLAQIRHQPAVMKEEFERALAVHPTKQLDPAQFSPDAIQLFQQALEASASTPPQPGSGAVLSDIGRRTSMHWIVAGDVRRRPAGFAVTLSVADVVAHDGKSENFDL